MFLSCGLVSKNHMLLNLPGILIPQNANHLLPGLSPCQLKNLSSDSRRGACRGDSLVWGPHCSPFLLLSHHSLFHKECPTKKKKVCHGWVNCQFFTKRGKGIIERSEVTSLYSQLNFTCILNNTIFFGPFLTDCPLLTRIIVFQVFSPQVIKINICISNLYYFIYLSGKHIQVVLGDYYNLNLGIYPLVFHSHVEVGYSTWRKPDIMTLHPSLCIELLRGGTLF